MKRERPRNQHARACFVIEQRHGVPKDFAKEGLTGTRKEPVGGVCLVFSRSANLRSVIVASTTSTPCVSLCCCFA